MKIINKNEIAKESFIKNVDGYVDMINMYTFNESECIIVSINNESIMTLYTKEIHEHIQKYEDETRRYIHIMSNDTRIATINFKSLGITDYDFYKIMDNEKYIELRCYT